MNKQKIPYEVPEAQTFEVRCEGAILTNSVKSSSIRALTYDEDEELDF